MGRAAGPALTDDEAKSDDHHDELAARRTTHAAAGTNPRSLSPGDTDHGHGGHAAGSRNAHARLNQFQERGVVNSAWIGEQTPEDALDAVRNDTRSAAMAAFSVLGSTSARLRQMRGESKASETSSTGGAAAGIFGNRWQRGVARSGANSAAKKMRNAQRLKALQRTPYPMVLARVKLLIDRLQAQQQSPTNGSPRQLGSPEGAGSPSPGTAKAGIFAAKPVTGLKGGKRMPPPSSPLLAESPTGKSSKGPAASTTAAAETDESRAMSQDKLIEELAITLYFLSEFIRTAPEETRTEACYVCKMENFKKDQVVYRPGDAADKFYIILAGSVEVWTQPPGSRLPRTYTASLKKGMSFGERAILNHVERNDCIVPSSNCTFLTIPALDFARIFSSVFEHRYSMAEDFFRTHVEFLSDVPAKDVAMVVRYAEKSTFTAGTEWEPALETQIYFIFEGAASLEAMDRKFVLKGIPKLTSADGATAAMVAESGDLANVTVLNGKAVGSLGHEAELRRLRKSLVPKKLIANLEVGAWLGGGPRIMGEGELQSCLRVLVTQDVVAYHMSVDQFFNVASPEMIRAIRDDVTFKLTYYYGRLGTIGADTVVGHSEAALHSLTNPTEAEASAGRAGPSSPSRTRRGGKRTAAHAGTAGGSGEMSKLAVALQEAQAQLEAGVARIPVALYIHGTPAERFWATPAFSGSSRSGAIVPLLTGIYPEGLAPLSDKIGEMVDRALDKHASGALLPLVRPIHTPELTATPSARGLISAVSVGSGGGCTDRGYQRPGTAPMHDGWGGAATGNSRSKQSGYGSNSGATPSFALRQPLGLASTGGRGGVRSHPRASYSSDGTSDNGDELLSGSLSARGVRQAHPGCLAAAGVLWQHMSDHTRQPGLRQCLTYDEIRAVKTAFSNFAQQSSAAEAAAAVGAGRRSITIQDGGTDMLEGDVEGEVPLSGRSQGSHMSGTGQFGTVY